MFDCMSEIQIISGFNRSLSTYIFNCSDLENSEFMKVYRNYDIKSFAYCCDNYPKYIIRI